MCVSTQIRIPIKNPEHQKGSDDGAAAAAHCARRGERIGDGLGVSPPNGSSASSQKPGSNMAFLRAVIAFPRCVLMYKGNERSTASKYSVLKGGGAVGSRACATVLCLFLIPWPQAMVCIFRTTAGYLQAGDHSSGFITAHKMTLVSLWSQLCLWCAEKPLHLIATKNCTNVQPDQPHKLPET